MRSIFISPHNDDEGLFGAFTIMANWEKVEVVIVYDSFVQVERGWPKATAEARRVESLVALNVMGIPKSRVSFLGLDDHGDDPNEIRPLIRSFAGERVWYPAYEPTGNRHHNAVALAVEKEVDLKNSIEYLTYTSAGKSTCGRLVQPPSWLDVQKKLIALSCYRTQLEVTDCRPHFLRSQEEYVV